MVDISDIKNITVVGAGVMGKPIAQVALMAGFEKVVLNDINMKILEKAAYEIENGETTTSDIFAEGYSLKELEAKAQLDEGLTCKMLMNRLHKEADLERAVVDADFVIEAVPEVMEIKQEVFRKLGKSAPAHTVLATNTSTMSISKIGEASGKPEKVIGMHFFGFPLRNRLIEITKGNKTSDEAMDICAAVGQMLPCTEGERLIARLKKETPGFIANRINAPGFIYVSWTIDQPTSNGIPYEQIDADVSEIMLFGPFELRDYVGLDTVYNFMKYCEETLSPDFAPGKTLTKLVKEKHLGRKTGKGFYDWSEGWPQINKSKKAGLLDPDILLALQLNEGCRLLEQGVVSGYEIIDDVNLAGYMNPGPFLPGQKNYERWSKLLEDFAEKSGKSYVKPCKLMKSGGFLRMHEE